MCYGFVVLDSPSKMQELRMLLYAVQGAAFPTTAPLQDHLIHLLLKTSPKSQDLSRCHALPPASWIVTPSPWLYPYSPPTVTTTPSGSPQIVSTVPREGNLHPIATAQVKARDFLIFERPPHWTHLGPMSIYVNLLRYVAQQWIIMDSYGTMCDCKSVHICTDNRYWWCKVVSPPAFESRVGYEKRFLLYLAVKGPLSSSPGGSHHSQRIPQMGGRPFQTSESSELSRQCREMARNGEMNRRPAVYDLNKT